MSYYNPYAVILIANGRFDGNKYGVAGIIESA